MLFEARSHYHHEGVAVNWLSSLCLALEIVSSFLSLFGELGPSLYNLEGRVTCVVLVGLGLFYNKWNPSLASFVREYSLCFPHKPAHH